MRGHWESGTRKLNRHYQSGGGSGWTTLLGMGQGLLGFKFGGNDDQYGPLVSDGYFYDGNSNNIIVAPVYKLWDSNPVSHSTENVNAIYGNWEVSDYGNGHLRNTVNMWISNIPIWRYPDITPTPEWIYSTAGSMRWYKPTESDPSINQHGKPMPSGNLYYLQNSSDSFENIYSGATFNILVPTFELIAAPYHGNNESLPIVLGQTSSSYTFESKIKVKNLSVSAYRVAESNSSSGSYETVPTFTDGINNDVYLNVRSGYSTPELGTFSFGDLAINDEAYVSLYDMDSATPLDPLTAGTYTDPVSGVTYRMVYYIRFKHLSIVNQAPTVLGFNHNL